jgi:hypothetical protein
MSRECRLTSSLKPLEDRQDDMGSRHGCAFVRLDQIRQKGRLGLVVREMQS